MFSVHERLKLAAPAAAGIVLAHWVAYALTTDPHERSHLLANTGHRFFPYIAAVCLGLFVAVSAGWVKGRMARPAEAGPGLVAVIQRLALIQLTGFLGLELVERSVFAHGVSLATFAEKPLLVGLLLQVIVAIVGALLARAVAHVLEIVASAATFIRADTVRWFVSQITRPTPRLVSGSLTMRGPPSI